MRLDKLISHNTPFSRSEVGRVLKDKRVTVNDHVMTKAAYQVKDTDVVSLDGEQLVHEDYIYLMMNKPQDVVCSSDEPDHKTVIDLLAPDLRHRNLQPAGRLDKDATGLVLITDDGQWNHAVTTPGRKTKTYQVETAEPITNADIIAFDIGVFLNGEGAPTRPALLEPLNAKSCFVTLTEGRYHQIKRMFAARGNRVTSLHRLSMGDIRLDPALAPGEWRALTAEEVASIGTPA
ncbi:pseudouridine synthase [Allohahella sp. A8]|uniref:pseudouridine synthase n=1 Tax=Allohahella sp. A8 TaxID=3141461 RepID=UPI000C099E23|nr:16S rRNA pseudouridine(516) synthase [Hahellaceae bacterium]|tara:strand:- start:30635 stop:31336 length:702 start_codon:yes stop_codon:yes gene_type:complete